MSSTRRSPEPGPRAGFTLIELVVALVLSGLLATVIFRLINGNSEFVRIQSAQEEVQQNARSALDIIASDLRSAPVTGVVDMSPGSVRFYAARGWGVLCDTVKAGGTTAWVMFSADAFPSDSVISRRSWGISLSQTPSPAQPAGGWRFVAPVGRSGAADPCGQIQPAMTSRHVRLGFTAPSGGSFTTLAAVLPGTPVMLYEEVQYDVAESTNASMPGHWIRRMTGYTGGGQPNMQPLAGPVPETGALTFTYLRADGVTPASTPDQVRRVRVQVVAESHGKLKRGASREAIRVDTLSTEVSLRN